MKLPVFLSSVATVLAGAALVVSLTHSGPTGVRGPTGPQGPAGNTGHSATVAHLGVCVSTDSSQSYVTAVTVPVVMAGVPSCPIGSFISIVPAQGN